MRQHNIMERRTFVFLLILPALVIARRWKSSSKPAWRRGDSLDRPGGWYGRRDDEPTRRREDPLDWSGDRYDSRDDDDVRYARGDQYNWRDDQSSRQNYRYDKRDQYDGRDRYNKRGDNQDDRRSYRYKTPTPPRYETQGDRLKKRITSRPPCDDVNDMAKKVTGYIATMTPAEARAAAFDIHGQWFGWGREMSKDLEIARALNIEAIIPSLLRGDVEDSEKLYMPAHELTKEQMLADLKGTNPNFEIPESMAKTYELSLHYLRWRYILKNRLENYSELKIMVKILTEVGITLDGIARYLALFFEKTSEKIHGAMKKLSVAEVKRGLIDNGVDDVGLLNTALTLFAVRRGKTKELDGQLQKVVEW